MPDGVRFAGSSAGCASSDGKVTCALGTLGGNQSKTVRIAVVVDAVSAGVERLTSRFDVSTDLSTVDLNLTTMGVLVDTPVIASDSAPPVDPDSADLVLLAIPGVDGEDGLILPDRNVARTTFSVLNLGPATATGVTLEATIPAGVTFEPGYSSIGCELDADSMHVHCDALGTLNVGLVSTVRIGFSVPPEVTLPTGTAGRVAANEDDPDGGNNSIESVVTQRTARITAITTNENVYNIEFKTFGYTPELPGRHVHFFFDTVSPDQAGVPGRGPWKLYGGPSPFTGYGPAARPAGATTMCILVANTDHSVIQGTGNCVPLPGN